MNAVAAPLPPSTQPVATDEELLCHYRDFGDPEAFATLVHRYEKPLYHYLVRYLKSSALAEEVFQATFLQVHQKCHLFAEGSAVRPWLYRIATNQAIDTLRREGRHHAVSLDEEHAVGEADARTLQGLLESTTASPLDQMEADERAEWTRQAVDSLPDHLRLAVLLIYFQGLKYHEASEVLHVPLGTIKSRMHKALLMLSRAWRRNHSPA
jgi:RNA polymerase sigma-70 factor (ECF subfamily)